uniref:Gustatory receptor n=1 Tax=Anopheles dirus TaxID=7168 RepID=A0A182NBY5_9DIPT
MDVVFQHLRVLIRCMRLLGIFGVQRRRSTVDNPYASVGAVKIKFVIFFSATVLGSAYTIVITLLVYNVSFTERFDIYPIVMTTHIVTLCVVLCILPWQTYGRNTHLAAILNVFHRNEKDLIAFTGSASNYGRAGRLATVIVWNGVLFHVFFHTYYIFETYNFAHGLFPFYLVCCLIMYEDLATEYLLGLCDCFLLIARIQLERLVSIARHSEIEDHQRELRVLFYVDMNNRICCMLRDNLCPYFGPIILTFCAYVCLEAAVCILDLFDVFSAGNNSILQMLANVLWPLSNLKKLIILLLYVEQLNAMYANMHVFGNLRVLIRCLRLMGLLSIKRHCGADGKPLFGTTSYAALKFTGFFIATVLGCGYLISQGSQEYDVLSQKGAIWPIVYVVHNVTFSVVFFVLPWQTFRQRYRLAAAMTALYQNEADLVKLTGNGTNYRIVSLLATVVMWNGVILHVFFHSYYISQNYSTGNDFLPIYFRSWLFMYVDLAMELILGVCDCSLLIARLQLERLVGIAKDFASSAETDRLLQFHVELYGKIVNLLRLDLSPYFGPIVLSFCVYVCLEVAVCSLDAHSLIGSKDRPIMAVLANIMWPLSDIKKLSALLLLGEGVNVMFSVYEDEFIPLYTVSCFFMYIDLATECSSRYGFGAIG